MASSGRTASVGCRSVRSPRQPPVGRCSALRGAVSLVAVSVTVSATRRRRRRPRTRPVGSGDGGGADLPAAPPGQRCRPGSLLSREGFDPEHVIVVVNGEGGLDSSDLEASVRMVRLPDNTGPAGGFRAGLIEAFADPGAGGPTCARTMSACSTCRRPGWSDCSTGSRRSDRAIRRWVRSWPTGGASSGGVPTRSTSSPREADLVPVDVACWGATLVSRRVVDAGVLPDPELFFGVEDFDFFCRVREAGLEVLRRRRGGPCRGRPADERRA